ncbi:MAG: hypothetical protein KAI40_11010 [Desulfobacterales bacterium]|nr:hypothetical protein [Desulfobacterales bacterium]
MRTKVLTIDKEAYNLDLALAIKEQVSCPVRRFKMIKIIVKLFCCTMISLFLVSCSSLKSEHYVGQKLPIHEELEEESIWQFEDKVFYVRVVSPANSPIITASSLQWNKLKNKYEIKTSQVTVTELKIDDADDSLFLNLKEEKEGLYTILRLIPSSSDKDMVIFTVDKGTIKKHIKEGKVKAVKKGDAFILKLTKEELDSYIRENLNEIFDYGGAGIIKPLKGFNEKE